MSKETVHFLSIKINHNWAQISYMYHRSPILSTSQNQNQSSAWVNKSTASRSIIRSKDNHGNALSYPSFLTFMHNCISISFIHASMKKFH